MEKEKLVPVPVPGLQARRQPGRGMAYLYEKKNPLLSRQHSNSYITAGLTGASRPSATRISPILPSCLRRDGDHDATESPTRLRDLMRRPRQQEHQVGGSNVGGSDSILAAMIGKAAGVKFNTSLSRAAVM